MKNEISEPRERFTDRVQDYVRARPSYPVALIEFLNREVRLRDLVAADVGAGTGLFSELLLEAGARVEAVEPNAAMRAAAIERLSGWEGFASRDGSAEATGLGAASIDLVACAQAFHWFDIAATRREFARILRPGGQVALVWNQRRRDPGFNEAYDDLQREFGGAEHVAVDERRARAYGALPQFFGPAGFTREVFPQHQDLDREGFAARFFSMSTAPSVDDVADRAKARRALDAVFDRFAVAERVRINYDCLLYFGSLGEVST